MDCPDLLQSVASLKDLTPTSSSTQNEVHIDVQEFCDGENILYLNDYMTNQEIISIYTFN